MKVVKAASSLPAPTARVQTLPKLNYHHALTLVSLASMTSLLHRVGTWEVHRSNQLHLLEITTFTLISAMLTLCIILQKRTPKAKKQAEELLAQILMLLQMRLAFARLCNKISVLLQVLLAWILVLIAMCERTIWQAIRDRTLLIRG